jgi:hypothetical protein
MMFLSTILFSAIAGAASPEPPKSHLAISYCDSGEHYQFEVVTCPIELYNTGDKPIRISKGEAKFPWDSIDADVVVPPKGKAYVTAKVDTRNDEGMTRRPFRFSTDEPGNEVRGSEVRMMVLSVLDQSKPKLDYGIVKPEEKLPELSIQLSSREAKDFRILGIESSPEWLDAKVDEDGRTLRAKLRANVPLGLVHHDHFVKLKIAAPQQKQAWVAVEANVLGDVVPNSNPVELGLMRNVGKHEFLIRLSSRSGKAFETGKLEMKGLSGKVEKIPCTPAKADCAMLKLDIGNDQPLGKLEGVLNVELKDSGRILPIELVGFLLDSKTKVHDMDELLKQSEQGQSKADVAAKPLDLGKAIEGSIKKEEPPLPGKGPLLRWSVANQNPIYGYIIYRADSEGGPFLRVNKDVVRAISEGADSSGSYQWRDNSAESGKTYWYRIGILNRNGSRQDLTGAQKVVAK